MNNKCFKMGIIQAFLDGELTSELSEKVIKHVAICDNCAMMMSEAEEENSFAFAALDEGLDVLVPTERLRTKLFTAIGEIENREKITIWQRFSGVFAIFSEINFASPAFAAVAATVMFVGSFAIALKIFPRLVSPNELAVNEPTERFETAPDVQKIGGGDDQKSEDADDQVVENSVSAPDFVAVRPADSGYQRASYAVPVNRKSTPAVRKVNRPAAVAPSVVGEEIYVQTIATLTRNIGSTKDDVMQPKERIEFEKNIAMVDNAISKMKEEVRKNPRNNAAKELLKASYQNKIDLLNSVSEKTELMASLD
ncbi:MAG: zf-HC2 domain-containing protein [Pyrinomonadaceae bacterium]